MSLGRDGFDGRFAQVDRRFNWVIGTILATWIGTILATWIATILATWIATILAIIFHH